MAVEFLNRNSRELIIFPQRRKVNRTFNRNKSYTNTLCVIQKKPLHSASFGFYRSEISSIFAVIKFELNERARIHKLYSNSGSY
jgi:hypothetical protein